MQMDYHIQTHKVLCFAKELGLEVGRAGSIHRDPRRGVLGMWASDKYYSRKLAPLKRASALVLGGARGPATCYFCSLNAPLGKAVGDREASQGGSSSCNLKTYPPSTIGSGAYTT